MSQVQQLITIIRQRNHPGGIVRFCLAWMLLALLVVPLSGAAPHNTAHAQTNTTSIACTGLDILFVGRETPLTSRDQPLVDRIVERGNSVTVRNQGNVALADTDGMDLIILSESVYSWEIGPLFRDVAVPLITWEAWLLDDLGMTGPVENVDYGETFGQKQIRIVNENHPLAAGLSGTVTTLDKKKDSERFHWGVPNRNAVVIATLKGGGDDDDDDDTDEDISTLVTPLDDDDESRIAIFGYDTGTAMVGMNAPARRAAIHNASGDNLTSDGWKLFAAAAEWASQCNQAEPDRYTLNVQIEGNGTVVKAPDRESYAPGTLVTLVALPNPGWFFDGWSGSLDTRINPLIVIMDRNLELTASFRSLIPVTETPTPTASATPVPPTSTPTPTSPGAPTATPGTAVLPPRLSAQMVDELVDDADEDGAASPGDTLRYVATIRNEGRAAATNVQFRLDVGSNTTLLRDSVESQRGTVNVADSGQSLTVNVGALGAGAQMEIAFDVVIRNPLPAMTAYVENQGVIRSADEPDLRTDDPDRSGDANPTRTEIDAAPQLHVEKTDFLLIDADADGTVTPGDTLIYIITLVNRGNMGAEGIRIDDVPDTSTTLINGSVSADGGTIVSGNGGNDSSVRVELDALAGGGASFLMTLQVQLNPVLLVDEVTNQASVSYSELVGGASERTLVVSDDPDSAGATDATTTQVNVDLSSVRAIYLPVAAE